MHFPPTLRAFCLSAALLVSATAEADEAVTRPIAIPESKVSFVDRASANVENAVEEALDLIGIRYKRGGSNPQTGFDCSGFVSHVFKEGLGLYLPRSSREISKTGEVVDKNELQPGDLVFFNTMRRTFSHVGIYLGDNLFVHAPRSGAKVRIEDMRERYWTKRYNGARRVAGD
ncbi:C40 family peptidase [Sulfurisoma sediminicola]|uniref:Cell wall-associated NlpC family hydrolase n=1 Tax=Sulfurisoma sediminicola TaxID=1381557 RepID=A0A497X7C9_9PROT|nr:C40 family peptidase [Sulfurisoma sediminicola]RLJ61441.1 cell wall-associated NlpC family hydrolase [Sulfurisoma sediminicola]